MSASGSSKHCPQCGAPLLDEMPFCRTCGWHITPPGNEAASANASTSEFIPYGAPEGQESWPLDQPPFPPQGQPTYPFQNQMSYPPPAPPPWATMPAPTYPYQGQVGPAGYAPTPTAPTPSRRS